MKQVPLPTVGQSAQVSKTSMKASKPAAVKQTQQSSSNEKSKDPVPKPQQNGVKKEKKEKKGA